MLIVQLKDGVTIDRALKILKNKVTKTKQVKKLRERQSFKKPSVVKREEIRNAIYIQQLKEKEKDESNGMEK
jgi:small subunit ribosomal protein S21